MKLTNEQLLKAVIQLLEIVDEQSNTIAEMQNQIDDMYSTVDQHELKLDDQNNLLQVIGNEVAELLFNEANLNSFDPNSGSPKKYK